MPLPLYGSGGRTLRISAAVWPTICLSMPLARRPASASAPRTRCPARGLTRTGASSRPAAPVGAAQRGAIADALDLEALLEALRDALDHVRDQRARQAVQRAILAALGRAGDDDRASSCAICIRCGTSCAARPSARYTVTRPGSTETITPAGTSMGFLPILLMRRYQTKQMTSPPMPSLCGGAARDDAAGGGQDRDAHAAEHARQPVLAGVDAAARLGDALQTAEHALAAAAVLQLDDERVGCGSPASETW